MIVSDYAQRAYGPDLCVNLLRQAGCSTTRADSGLTLVTGCHDTDTVSRFIRFRTMWHIQDPTTATTMMTCSHRTDGSA